MVKDITKKTREKSTTNNRKTNKLKKKQMPIVEPAKNYVDFSDVNIDAIIPEVLKKNRKINLSFYKYLFIVTFSLLIFSLLWSAYFYDYSSDLKKEVDRLDGQLQDAINTVSELVPGNTSPEIKQEVTNSSYSLVKEMSYEFNFDGSITAKEAQDVSDKNDFPLVVPISYYMPIEKVEYSETWLGDGHSELGRENSLHELIYSYEFSYRGYDFKAQFGHYAMDAICADDSEVIQTKNFGELQICNTSVFLSIPFDEKYSFPADLSNPLLILSANEDQDTSANVYKEVIDSLEIFVPTK